MGDLFRQKCKLLPSPLGLLSYSLDYCFSKGFSYAKYLRNLRDAMLASLNTLSTQQHVNCYQKLFEFSFLFLNEFKGFKGLLRKQLDEVNGSRQLTDVDII